MKDGKESLRTFKTMTHNILLLKDKYKTLLETLRQAVINEEWDIFHQTFVGYRESMQAIYQHLHSLEDVALHRAVIEELLAYNDTLLMLLMDERVNFQNKIGQIKNHQLLNNSYFKNTSI